LPFAGSLSKGGFFLTGASMSFDPDKMKADILNLKEGVRLCYYTGCTGWLDGHPALSAWFAKMRRRGIYGFSQRKITDRHEHNIYEYYIWVLKTPEIHDDAKRIMAVRRSMNKR